MKKIEIIWRELLFQSIEKKKRRFIQKNLAEQFGFSTSTVFQSLRALRQMGAVRVSGRFFVLEDPEKLLYHWASYRNLKRDIIFAGRVELTALEIESGVPASVIFGGFSAARLILTEPPADYDQIYAYTHDPELIQKRFKFGQGAKNLFVLKADKFLASYGQRTTLAQTFVDLWNLDEWYAKEFVRALKQKIDELLS